jgi:protease PrsW
MNTSTELHKQKSTRGPKGQTWAPRWWGVLLIGVVLWAATVAVEFLTGNLIVLPSIVLLGSFLVPVTAVVWYLDHDPSQALSPRRIATAFIVAGLLGMLVASMLEFWLVYGPGVRGDLKVGFIEEFVKGVGIVALAWGLRTFTTRDGMVLGAAVGFGFAALEVVATRWPRSSSSRDSSSFFRCRRSF